MAKWHRERHGGEIELPINARVGKDRREIDPYEHSDMNHPDCDLCAAVRLVEQKGDRRKGGDRRTDGTD